ncbi:MAG: UvrD-helicase domain-containing protein [Verrucomicrobiales bacterium]|nr:UvrD-helicase domain-containing protein [Verrucomicrobiales bacterium]
MNAGFNGLNPAQRQAAEHNFGPLLILAGAGTGKTRVVTTRIAGMLYNGIPASQILAVTFTNKAAVEMRERVDSMVENNMAEDVMLCTFHSLCVRILRTCIERLGYKKNFSIFTQSDQMGIIKQILVRKAGKDENIDAFMIQSQISNAKNTGTPVSEDENSLISDVYRTYQKELKAFNAVDFDDLILLAVKALRENDDIRESWQKRFRFVMVDEFQDTNNLQMELLQLVVNKEHNICVVGDDDQSIYGWRGADITNILDFERFFPNPTVVKLEENYRSVNRVLRLANSVIRHNIDRREKTLWSSQGEGDKIKIASMPDAQTEAEYVVTEIMEKRHLDNRKWEDFAILFRTNTQSRVMEEQLREHEVPYRVIGGQSFYEKREIKDLLSYLSLMVNPDDDVSLLRIVNTPPRGIGKGTIESATQYSIKAEQSIFEAFQDEEFLSTCSTRARNALDGFVELVHTFADTANTKTGNYATMTEDLIREIEYEDFLKRSCKTADEANSRRKNVADLVESMYAHTQKKKRGLRRFLDSCALMQDKDKEKEQGDEVSLITMHASKGLEFPVCHLIGMEEGILPHSRSIEEGTKDEERRLLYVGITRAKEQLTITWCHSRKKWGDKVPCMPSTFFNEMDKNECEETSYEEIAEEPVNEDYAANFFQEMKAMLSQ